MIFSELELLLKFPFEAKSQATLVDVGAHAGFVSVRFSRKGWRVIAFEPEPENRKDLQERLKPYKDVTIIPKAVSNKEGELVPFYVSSEHWGIHSLKPFHPTHKPTLTVETVRLDKTLNRLGVNHVSLLKIDVEGADFSVLQGFDWDKIKPEMVMCEFADDRSLPNFGCTHHDIACYMEGKGYKVFVSEWAPIKEYGRKGEKSDPHQFLQCVPYPLDHQPAWGNLIFVRRDRLNAFEKVLSDYLADCGLAQGVKMTAKVQKRLLPTISIVTPSFNQAQFVEKCLKSVESQSYLPIEHIILDPGSSDGSIGILQAYARKNPSFVQLKLESDQGQVDAINKGLMACNGDIVAWLNSDDYYYDNKALQIISQTFSENPDIDVVYGRGNYVDERGKKLKNAYIQRNCDSLLDTLQCEIGILQPALFFRRSVLDKIGLLDPTYNLSLDYEYWVRMANNGIKFKFIDRYLVNATLHNDSKTCSQRLLQYEEIFNLVYENYGYVPINWIERYANFFVTGKEAMLMNSQEKDDKKLEPENIRNRINRITSSLLLKYNTRSEALLEVVVNKFREPYLSTYKVMKSSGMIGKKNLAITTFDRNYFQQGINLIAGIHRTSLNSIDMILVFDLGMEEHQKQFLNKMKKVRIVSYPSLVKNFYDEYLNPKNLAYKCAAIYLASDYAEDGDSLLFLDAGVTPIRSLDEIFDIINREGAFFVDHNDLKSWPFYNITFVHSRCAELMEASNEELLAPHLCSCLVGYRKAGPFQKLIKEAYEYSQIRDISLWPKHLPFKEKFEPKLSDSDFKLKRFLEKNPSVSNLLSYDKIAKLYPYYGHRQDQSIYSILASRYQCKLYPAIRYNRSSEASSRASKENWLSGGEWREIQRSRHNADSLGEEVVIYHHRGTYNNLDGLRFVPKGDGEQIFVLGNGPSMKGFDFRKFKNAATIGMNAAYRYWGNINWFPTYYCCMDLVVLESHKESVYKLIQERSKNGIRMFFLRENILKTYPDLAKNSAVFILEEHRDSFSLLNLEPITTGSFSALFSALLGYKSIYLLGIDCNYVEFISQAKRRQGTVLEIAESPDDNPNYFFAGYQKKGDRYNIPNPNPGLHLRSWVALQKHIATTSVKIFNCNPSSKLDIFPFVELEDVLVYETKKDIAIKAACRQIVLERDAANLESALAILAKEPSYCEEIGIAARKYILQSAPQEEKEPIKSPAQYNSLVWLAWSNYNIGNFEKMKNYLAKSLEYSPYTSVETIVNWAEHFTQFAREQGCEFNVDKLSDSQEWEQLIKSVVM